MWGGAKYAVTDKLDVMVGYYHYIQNNFFVTGPNVGCSSSAHSQRSGTFDAVSGVIDWRFAAKWDAYTAACSHRTTVDWPTAICSATTSIRQSGFASASD
jgi:hypothetical protein